MSTQTNTVETENGFQLLPGKHEFSIEIEFTGKPNAEIRTELKENGFRWHGKKKVWYGPKKFLPCRYSGDSIQAIETDKPLIIEPINNAEKFRSIAESMQTEIDNKMNPGVANQNPTARRARIAASMALDGEKLQEQQSLFYAMASDSEENTLPEIMNGATNKVIVKNLFSWFSTDTKLSSVNKDSFKYGEKLRLQKAGFNTDSKLYSAFVYMNEVHNRTPKKDNSALKIRELESGLIGCKIPGYFPTPQTVVDLMIDHAGLIASDRVLEPSAGNGMIADSIAKTGATLDCVEVNATLRDILELKNHNLVGYDFLEFEPIGFQYNAVLMNPPFENQQDLKHFVKAINLVKTGGKIISIIGENAFFSSNQNAVDFRTFLEQSNAEIIDLENAFNEKGLGRIRTTGARSRLVILEVTEAMQGA